MRLTPEQLEVAIIYRVPEPVVNKLVAGARYEVQKTIRELEPEVLTVRFRVKKGALVPIRS